MVSLPRILLALFVPFLLVGITGDEDFELARDLYQKNNFPLARICFENFIKEHRLNLHLPDAEFYLIAIYDRQDRLLDLIAHATRFLDEYRYDQRGCEVFYRLIKNLVAHDAFVVAGDCLKRYDYLINDYSVLGDIALGLLKMGNFARADSILAMCPLTDSIRILRARTTSDPVLRLKMINGIDGTKGKIYLIEHYLAAGDTVNAYTEFIKIPKKIDADLLYRYAKIAFVLERTEIHSVIKRLSAGQYRKRALLLEAFLDGRLTEKIVPADEEEVGLLVQIVNSDTINRSAPDGIVIGSPAEMMDHIDDLRKEYGSNYYLDSIYARGLIDQGRAVDAYAVMARYLGYRNVEDYVRQVRAFKHSAVGDWQLALNDVIMCHDRSPEMIFLLAQGLRMSGRGAAPWFEDVVNTTQDSILYRRALKYLIEEEFAHGDYRKIAKYSIEELGGDSAIVKIYMKSLLRSGDKKKVDHIAGSIFDDVEFVNSYGEFFISEKAYKKARVYYDSIVDSKSGRFPDIIYYNWALVPFLQDYMDTALARFEHFVNNWFSSELIEKALFKIATIRYLRGDYEGAADYYGLASRDTTLQDDALQNQIICYKKLGYWEGVIEVARRMIALHPGETATAVHFELGYALLNRSDIIEAIEILKTAANEEPTPEHLYWLGEAYLLMADLIRALYQFQRISYLYPNDEMWMPTARFKTGIVLESMAEIEAAKEIYRGLIRKRGLADVWGAEAQKRLAALDQ